MIVNEKKMNGIYKFYVCSRQVWAARCKLLELRIIDSC